MDIIYNGSNKEYVLDNKIKNECLFLNKIYNNGYHLKYLNELKSNYISKRTYAYLKNIAKGEENNILNLETGLIEHYGIARYVKSAEWKRVYNKEDLELEMGYHKSRVDYLIINKMVNLLYSDDRPRDEDRMIDIVFNEKEAMIFDTMMERREKRRYRDLKNRREDFSEEILNKYIKEYCNYRNMFYETAMFFNTARHMIRNEEVKNLKLFKQENYEEFKEGRDRRSVRTVKFRICKQTLKILESFNLDMNEKDLCKYIIYLTMFFHLLGDEDYSLITKLKDYTNINYWLFSSEDMS